MRVRKTREYEKWFRRLKDTEVRARVDARIRRITVDSHLGDAKPIGEGVFELRIDTGPGIRLYYALRGNELLLLLIGGDKTTQQRDIAKAKRINRAYERI